MALILKIAWRNIQRHRGKSLVVGIIIFLGAMTMTIGNGVIAGMDRGLKENVIDRFTGDVVIISAKQDQDNVIFTPMGRDIEVIPGYEKVKKVLEGKKFIDRFLPVAKGLTIILNENGDMSYALALGVRFDEYRKMFSDSTDLVEGTLLKNDDRGILVSTGNRKRFFEEQNFWVIPEGFSFNEKNFMKESSKKSGVIDKRTSLVLMGGSNENSTMDIRVDVKGVMKFKHLDDFWNHFNIMDIESFREVYQYVTASDTAAVIPKEKKRILEKDNLDDLFGGEVLEKVETRKQGYDVSTLMGKKVVQKKLDVDSGAYNLIFVKLGKGADAEESVLELNAAFKSSGAEARAIIWRDAVGQIADLSAIMRGATRGFVFLIFIVAIIIIMNTLSMAALERVSEIGMMRAVGAHKSFISGMFLSEMTVISIIFGCAGIIAGIVSVYILNAINITTENRILELLFGGSVFRPVLGIFDILKGFAYLALVTLIATAYPLRVARRITPLDAIMRD
ncbi:MAG: FtsX-like permease family protein [Spirochaetes bacterium]|jgi:putative ABC transport system permease protein|nr:FtsX-like permease family protein [Spirochaetota bacterium]